MDTMVQEERTMLSREATISSSNSLFILLGVQ